LENFNKLPEGKQQDVINAGLTCFAHDGYKKAAISEIAQAAGVSKASVFHYFGTKAALYLYLVDYTIDLWLAAFAKAQPALASADFFERLVLSVQFKMQLMKANPAILLFITSMYYEQEDQVRPAINQKLRGSEGIRAGFMLDGIDGSRFRQGVDPKLILKMMGWLSAGIAEEWHGKPLEALDDLLAEFYAITEMLKQAMYQDAGL
jgi:AcrR family transcriptional regulator